MTPSGIACRGVHIYFTIGVLVFGDVCIDLMVKF
jgi:hypothetical protein